MKNELLLKEKIDNIPSTSGVYKFYNEFDEVIYVGKAKNLRKRVKSYFYNKFHPTSKTAQLVKNISNIKYIETYSEVEALILESSLIKKYNPKYNISLKDDKSHLYIVIRKKKFKNSHKKMVVVPSVHAVRKPDIKQYDKVFGPFPEASAAKYIVRSLRKIFPFRDCTETKFNKYQKLKSPCLYGHIGLCLAPCVGNLSVYKKVVNNVETFLNGDGYKLIDNLENKMLLASKSKNYEDAIKYRDQIRKYKYVLNKRNIASDYIENPYLIEDILDNALNSLVTNLNLSKIPKRIECYDISNLAGTDAVGSMVVAIEGRLKNSEYRRFKINGLNVPNDYEMMKQVLFRRFKREVGDSKKQKWGLPDLVVVDGGKPQTSAALEVMVSLKLNIPVIGLAKKHEVIILYDKKFKSFSELKLDKSDEGLKLLQRLRDESHRFAQQYHHKLRLNKI